MASKHYKIKYIRLQSHNYYLKDFMPNIIDDRTSEWKDTGAAMIDQVGTKKLL